MSQHKQKGSPVLEHQTNQKGISITQSISQDNKFIPQTLTDLCDADLAVTSGEIAYCRQIVRLGDLRLRRGDSSETRTQTNT